MARTDNRTTCKIHTWVEKSRDLKSATSECSVCGVTKIDSILKRGHYFRKGKVYNRRGKVINELREKV